MADLASRQSTRSEQVARFCAYACVGAAGTGVHYALLAALVSTHTLGAVAASCLGAVAGALVNYLLNYRLTFRGTGKHRTTAPRFFTVAAAGVGLNSALMNVCTERLALPWLAAQILSTAAVLALTYCANSAWSFRRHQRCD